MLSDRRQKVLQALIEEYIEYAQPVGSGTLVDRYSLGVSSATVRNELSILEDQGYLVSPHTSAGRVPTDTGYRAFVDNLIDNEFEDDIDDAMFDELRNAAMRADSLIEETSAALARFTDCLSVVLTPSLLHMEVKQLSLISLTPHRVLIVVVTEEGQVCNRTIELTDQVTTDELAEVQNALNEVFAGCSCTQIRSMALDVTISVLVTPLARIIIDETLICLNEANSSRAHRLGLSSLLQKPEFSHSRAALPILHILEDDTVLVHMFDDIPSGDMLEVRIGSENKSEDLSGISVVASQYGPTDNQGVVAVIGPTRMDYSTVIKAVRAAKSMLQDM